MGLRGSCNVWERAGLYSRYVAIPCIYSACRTSFQGWIFSCKSNVSGQQDKANTCLFCSGLLLVSLTCPSRPFPIPFFHRVLQSSHCPRCPSCLLFPLHRTCRFLPCLRFCLERRSLEMLGLASLTFSFASVAVHMCLLHGRCPINIY